MVGRLLSYWEGNFSGAMLNFGMVTRKCSFAKVVYPFETPGMWGSTLVFGRKKKIHESNLVLKKKTCEEKCGWNKKQIVQWLFLVPLKGGR